MVNDRKRGGARPGAGRKSRAEELGLYEKLQPMEATFLAKLQAGLKKGNPMALKMFAEYFYGKPTERHEHCGPGGEAMQFAGKHVVEYRKYGDSTNL